MGQHGEDPHRLSRVIALLVQSMGLGLVAFWWPIVVHPNLREPEAATGYQKYTLFLQPVLGCRCLQEVVRRAEQLAHCQVSGDSLIAE